MTDPPVAARGAGLVVIGDVPDPAACGIVSLAGFGLVAMAAATPLLRLEAWGACRGTGRRSWDRGPLRCAQ